MKCINIIPHTNIYLITLLAISIGLLQACGIRPQQSSASDGKDRVIMVTSNPAGAIIRANGVKLGETPLKVDLSKAFSPEWVSGENYGVDLKIKGQLIFEKNGCNEYVVPVSDTEPTDDINITLTCTEEVHKTSKKEADKTSENKSTDQRLKKLEKLYKDGVISEDEYKQHRNRILDEL